MRVSIKSALPPLVFIAAGVYLLIGCIPLPGSRQRIDGQERPERAIGDPDSSKPLRLNRSMLADVATRLGPPRFSTPDRRLVAYHYEIHAGTIVLPLCFHAEQMLASRFLVVRFGPTGILESYKVYKGLNEIPEWKRGVLRETSTWPDEQRYRPGSSRPEPAPPLPGRENTSFAK